MHSAKDVLGLFWAEVIALGLAYLFYMAYRDPARNRATRFVDQYWQWWLKRPLFGFGLFRSSRGVSLFNAGLMLFLGVFLLVIALTVGFK